MTAYDYDLLVIGAGSGGVSASRRAAAHGAKVAICESDRVGGTCVIRGCVPKKLFVHASHYAEDFHDAAGFGWHINAAPSFDWPQLIANKDKEIDRLNTIYLSMLEKAGVTLLTGAGMFMDPHTVKIGDKTVTAAHILIATGSWPSMPTIPGIQHAISSNEAFHLPELPKRIVIVGGGYIAVEFAGIFNGLGSEVTLLYRGEKILRGFDQDIQDYLSREIIKKGIQLHTNINVDHIEILDGKKLLTLTDSSVLDVDVVMYATGRKPNTSTLSLETVGVDTKENGAITVNDASQTSVPHIYAIGDVTDRVNLTPVAINEGRAFADSVFGANPRTINYRNIPSAVFSQPSVATAGLTEAEARKTFDTIAIYQSEFRPLKHTLSGSSERCFMKLIVDEVSDKVIGIHMVGADAAEIIQGFAVALQCGATKAQFDATIAIHPSSAEEFVTMREKHRN